MASTSTNLAHLVVFRVQVFAEAGQQFGPVLQFASECNGSDQDTDGGSNQRRRATQVGQALGLYELGDMGWELIKVGTYVVLQYQTAQRSSGFIYEYMAEWVYMSIVKQRVYIIYMN